MGTVPDALVQEFARHIQVAAQSAPPVQVSPQGSADPGAAPTRGAMPVWHTIQPVLADLSRVVARDGLEFLGMRFGPAAMLLVQAVENQFPDFFRSNPQAGAARDAMVRLAACNPDAAIQPGS
jgi:hypothetical protein